MVDIDEVLACSSAYKVLYVEDNEEARDSTSVIFEDFFASVIIAVNGEDGLEKFKSNDIDIIITDINMPKMNGIEMIKKIKEIDDEVPILILSAHNESSHFIDSIKLGVEGYLLKPIDMDQFLLSILKTTQKLKIFKQARTNMHFLKEYQDATNESLIVSKTDIDGVITFVNDEFCEISGYSQDELIGEKHSIIKHSDTPDSLYEELWDTIKNKKKTFKCIFRNLTKDKKSYYVDTMIKPILDEKSDIVEFIALEKDVTQIINPTRQFHEAISNSKKALIVYIKIEDFEMIEEFYNSAMIRVLQDKLEIFLEHNIPDICGFDKVYNLDNGEYGLLSSIDIQSEDMQNCIEKLKVFQEKIRDKVINLGEIEYDISVIMSIAYDDNALESAKLGIKKLLNSKKSFIVANNLAKVLRENAQNNIQTLSLIKRALGDCRIISYFQPITNNKTKKIEKYESLVRLIDEDGKILSPFFFLDVAKKGKYYMQITDAVLDSSFSALVQTNLDISINLSVLDIERKSTREKVLKLLTKYSEHADRVVFELLEDESVKDFKIIKSFVSEVKAMGAKIAIDDFGSGYSNFERLLEYQPDILKIDGSLIKNIDKDEFSYSVVETMVSFAKKQGIKTVAEFVENDDILRVITDLGINYGQGYGLGRPVPLEEILRDEKKAADKKYH